MRDQSRKTRSEGKTKALDALDKHMTQRSTLKKSLTVTGPNVLALSEGLVLNHVPTKSENVYQRSPTPRRSRGVDVVTLEERAKKPVFEEDSPVKSPSSSPMRKGVSFSDQIESSPAAQNVASSPIKPSSMTKPPGKSILKHPSLQYSKHESSSGRISPIKASHLSIDPSSAAFWVEGEIRNMINVSSVAEFRKIITGGLHVLNSANSRDFEIYATFNNIVPSMNGVVLNDIVHHKVDVIIENIEPLLDTSVYVLSRVQESLLLQKKKDPFKSRCFIQVIRFLTLLFSNFKIIKYLDGNLSLQLKFTEVLKACEEALTHPNTNKVMVIYPLTLLKEEKFGQFYLPDSQIRQLVDSVFRMKYLDSTNVQCERLMVLKHFLQKYSKVMLETLIDWFPSEIVGRYLMEDRVSSAKIRSCCNLIILDLLRKCISNEKVRATINDIESLSVSHSLAKVPNLDEAYAVYSESVKGKSIGEALCHKLISLINEKEEYKLTMDFWLGMTGLLFNSAKNLPLLLEPVGKRWLEVNEVCFNSNKKPLKGIAIKSRRILNYMIIANISLEVDTHTVRELIQIVMQPFELLDVQGLSEYIIFAFNSIMYLACCDYKEMNSKRFALLFDMILKPLFQRINSSNLLPLLGPQAHQIFYRILRTSSEEENSSPRRAMGFQPLKALSTVGVDLPDFEPMSNAILENNWGSIVQLLKSIITWPGFSPQHSLAILQHLVKKNPPALTEGQTCSILLEYFSMIAEEGDVDRSSESFRSTVRAFADKFGLQLFSNESIFLTKIIPMEGADEEAQFDLFKTTFQQVKAFVKPLLLFGYFGRFNNNLISNYIANIVGSMLIPTNITQQEYRSFLQIVNKMPVPEVIDNLFTWLRKTNNWGSIAGELSLSTWDDHLFANFIQKWIQEQKNSWTHETVSMITGSLWKKPAAFKELSSLLINAGQHQIIKETLQKNPGIINDISPFADLPLLEVLPVELVRLSFSKIHEYDDVIKTKLFLCGSVLGETDIVKSEKELLYQLLLPTDDDVSLNSDRNTIIDILIGASAKSQDWQFLSMLYEVCLARKASDTIIESFTSNKLKFGNLEPHTIALMVNKCGKLNSDIIEFIRDGFATLSPDYVITLMEELLKLTKYHVFNMLKNEVLSFSFDAKQQLSDENKETLMKFFPSVVDYFIENDSKALAEIMKYAVNVMKNVKEKQYGTALMALFLTHPDFKIQGNKTLIKKLNVFKANAKRQTARKYKFFSPKDTTKTIDSHISDEQKSVSVCTSRNPSEGDFKDSSLPLPEVLPSTPPETSDGKNLAPNDEVATAPVQIPTKAGLDIPELAPRNLEETVFEDSKIESLPRVVEENLTPRIDSDTTASISKAVPVIDSVNSGDAENAGNPQSQSVLPVKIPIFNPFFSDSVKLEGDMELQTDPYVSTKRTFERAVSDESLEAEDPEAQFPPKKIMKLVDSLSSIKLNEVEALSENEKKALRKSIYNFMLKLED